MLLRDKVIVIYGAGGAIGGAVARTSAREGAKVFLSGRNVAPVEAVAKDIIAAGGKAEVANVDALDEDAVEQYTADVSKKAGRIDVVLNAIGFSVVQGIPLVELDRELDPSQAIAVFGRCRQHGGVLGVRPRCCNDGYGGESHRRYERGLGSKWRR